MSLEMMVGETQRARARRGALALCAIAWLAGPQPVLANDDVVVLQVLTSTGADADATARARWRDKGAGELDFNVEIEKIPAGSYELLVGGTARGTITVGSLGQGEIEFETPLDSPKPLFNFPVFGQPVVVRQGTATFFSASFGPGGQPGTGGGGTSGGGGGNARGERSEVFMVNVGPDANAKGRLRFEDSQRKRKFEVDSERLDAGTYELFVGGDLITSFASNGVETEIDFQNPPDDNPTPGTLELPLTFEPRGKIVEIKSGATTYLAGLLPGAASQTGSRPPTSTTSASDLGGKHGDALQVALLNVGTLSGAKGKAKLSQNGETEFEVEIENVANGSFDLFVGGVKRGTIVVAGGIGEIKFSSSPGAGAFLLDFTVKGASVEIKLGTDTILGRLFPIDVQSAIGRFRPETRRFQVRMNLVNSGTDLDATGAADWRLQTGSERLKLEATDLPAGSYRVFVADVLQGSAATDTRGGLRIEFDSRAGSANPLDFAVFQQEVRIVNASGQTLLEGTIE